MLNRAKVEMLKLKYPKGTRIRLIHMDDPFAPVEDGTLGTVEVVDDGGQIHIHWDNGRGLALVPEVDVFEEV